MLCLGTFKKDEDSEETSSQNGSTSFQNLSEKGKNDEILRKYSKEDNERRLNKVVGSIVNVIAGIMAAFLIYTAAFGAFPQMQQRSLYLLFAMVILFLVYPAFAKKDVEKGTPWYDFLFALLALIACGYVVVMHENILVALGVSNTTEQILFLILTVLVLEGTRRLVSPALALVTILFLLYGYFGHLAPGVFRIRTGGISRLANHLYMIPEGIFGTPLALAAGYVSLFVLFSSLLQASGMGVFFQEVALRLTGHKMGGLAKVSVVSSAMFGSLSGSAAANVVGTGTFTIPLMKKSGYPSEFAGAVEAVSSTGGQLVPPVMGAAAFVMSEYIGVPYSQIMLAALIPATLYFLSVFIAVDLRSRKLGLVGIPKEQLPDLKKAVKERGHLVIPFFTVIYMIIRQYSISYAALHGIVLVIVFAQMRKTTRMSFLTIVHALVDGAKKTVAFGVSCACVGLIIGITTMTSVGIILGNYILEISKGNLFFSLILVMLMSILFGMGMPTVAVYVVLATVACPILVQMGLPILAAHFFAFYFGILACITPPVAVPAYAAAALAGANPGRTGWAAFKMALPAFIVPFIFVYSPSILFIETNYLQLIWVTFTCVVGIFMVAIGNERFLFRDLPKWKTVLAYGGGILSILPEGFSDFFGLAVFLFILITEYLACKRKNNTDLDLVSKQNRKGE